MNIRRLITLMLIFVAITAVSFAADNSMIITQLNAKISQSQTRLQAVEKLSDGVARDLLAAREQLSYAAASEQTDKDDYARISGELDNALQSRYSDMDAVSRLQQQKNAAWQSYLQAQSAANMARGKVSALEKQRNDYDSERQRLAAEISSSRAQLFDIEYKTPVWVEGYGEAVMTKTISHADCENAAVQAARRDAIEKAGGIFVTSVTVVENNQVTRDEIKARINAVILKQDNSGSYGTPQYVVSGDYGKYIVKVRVFVQNTSDYNPYRPLASATVGGASGATGLPVNAGKTAPSNVLTQSTTGNNNYSQTDTKQGISPGTPAANQQTYARRYDERGWAGIGYGFSAAQDATITWKDFSNSAQYRASGFKSSGLSGLSGEIGYGLNEYFSLRAVMSLYNSTGQVVRNNNGSQEWVDNGTLSFMFVRLAGQVLAEYPLGAFRGYIGIGAGIVYDSVDVSNAYGVMSAELKNNQEITWYFPATVGLTYFLDKDWSVSGEYTFMNNADANANSGAALLPSSMATASLKLHF